MVKQQVKSGQIWYVSKQNQLACSGIKSDIYIV